MYLLESRLNKLFYNFKTKKFETIPNVSAGLSPLHKYRRKVKDFTFLGLACVLWAVTKISTIYKFDKGHVATDAIGTGNFKR